MVEVRLCVRPLMFVNETIAAISTPPGRGGIGIVRVSGPDALAIVSPLLRLRTSLAAGRARRAQVLDPGSGRVLDEAVATYFAAPRSYTTEDVVEIACHGAPVLLATVLAACLAQGARLAEPGEFTQRAYLAGRLDLTEAEAVHDLIAASTLAQARTAAAQLGGSISRAIAPVRHLLLGLIAELEAGIDFAEDDLDLLAQEALLGRLDELKAALLPLAETYRFGRVLHAGFTLAVAGRPNAGKSSLFNRLLGRNRAIVTDQPGTTRDPIEEHLELDGIPVRLIDTAGLRAVPEGSAGEPERQGIARSREVVAEADVVLLIEEALFAKPGVEPIPGHPSEDLLRELSHQTAIPSGRPVLHVLTKADLLSEESSQNDHPANAILTSALTGQGMETLRQAILQSVTGSPMSSAEGAIVTNLRQHTALLAALNNLRSAHVAGTSSLPHELLLLDLYQALESLDLLTGATERDEVLNRIFSTFCIGK